MPSPAVTSDLLDMLWSCATQLHPAGEYSVELYERLDTVTMVLRDETDGSIMKRRIVFETNAKEIADWFHEYAPTGLKRYPIRRCYGRPD